MTPASRKHRRLFFACLAALLVALSGWVALDLFSRRTRSLRDFNPGEVARLDTAMWRSYYAKQRLLLFSQLTELLRKEYHLPWLQSQWIGYQAAKAAFVFKAGRSRNDYEKALPHLRSFYAAISASSDDPFDIDRAAELELEWWIVHREREKHSPEDLPRLLAQTSAVMYHMPYEPLLEHGKLRAAAMKIRDDQAAVGGVTEQDWSKIASLLDRSWRSLWQAVNTNKSVGNHL
jgi:hypothetical protein